MVYSGERKADSGLVETDSGETLTLPRSKWIDNSLYYISGVRYDGSYFFLPWRAFIEEFSAGKIWFTVFSVDGPQTTWKYAWN